MMTLPASQQVPRVQTRRAGVLGSIDPVTATFCAAVVAGSRHQPLPRWSDRRDCLSMFEKDTELHRGHRFQSSTSADPVLCRMSLTSFDKKRDVSFVFKNLPEQLIFSLAS